LARKKEVSATSGATAVVPLHRAMTDAEYDQERERIRSLYGDKNEEAIAKRDAALALLCQNSRWTQDKIAAKERMSRQWVDHHLRFARFLAFQEIATTGSYLSERAFRVYWNKTGDGDGSRTVGNTDDERARFRKVQVLITDRAASPTFNPVTAAVREHFTDGRWHGLQAIASRIEQDPAIASRIEENPEVVEQSLNHALGRASKKYKINRRRAPGRAGGWQYQVVSLEQQVSTVILEEKLRPLIEQLQAQTSTNMATVSITTFATVARALDRLLDEWCGRS
jgi:hypothetical protein